MVTTYARNISRYINDQKRCLGALLGIAQGLLCDRVLSDLEIHFLDDWLKQNDEICVEWPGDILHGRVKEVLADGIITEGERAYLVEELKKLIGGNDETLAAARHVTELAFDDVAAVKFPGMSFCLTGDFVYGPRDLCTTEIQKLGGMVLGNVTKRLHYLVIGSLGSPEWKHGSFGTKVEKAMKYKQAGLSILIVPEECWATSLRK